MESRDQVADVFRGRDARFAGGGVANRCRRIAALDPVVRVSAGSHPAPALGEPQQRPVRCRHRSRHHGQAPFRGEPHRTSGPGCAGVAGVPGIRAASDGLVGLVQLRAGVGPGVAVLRPWLRLPGTSVSSGLPRSGRTALLAGLWSLRHRCSPAGAGTAGGERHSLGNRLDAWGRTGCGHQPGAVLLPFPSGERRLGPRQTLTGGAAGHRSGSGPDSLVGGPHPGAGMAADVAGGLASHRAAERLGASSGSGFDPFDAALP